MSAGFGYIGNQKFSDLVTKLISFSVAEAKQILEEAKRSATDQRLKIVRSAKEDITRMIEEATRKVMEGDASGDPYEDFLREMERKA